MDMSDDSAFQDQSGANLHKRIVDRHDEDLASILQFRRIDIAGHVGCRAGRAYRHKISWELVLRRVYAVRMGFGEKSSHSPHPPLCQQPKRRLRE